MAERPRPRPRDARAAPAGATAAPSRPGSPEREARTTRQGSCHAQGHPRRNVAERGLRGVMRCYAGSDAGDRGDLAIDAAAAAKPRPRSELLLRAAATRRDRGVRLLARLGVDPQARRVDPCAVGAGGRDRDRGRRSDRVVDGRGRCCRSRRCLDNIDGGLARATGRVTQMGRYLDTVLDTLVNAAAVRGAGAARPRGLGGRWRRRLPALIVDAVAGLQPRAPLPALRVGCGATTATHPAGASERWLAAFRGFYEPSSPRRTRRSTGSTQPRSRASRARRTRRAPLDHRACRSLAWNDLWSTADARQPGPHDPDARARRRASRSGRRSPTCCSSTRWPPTSASCRLLRARALRVRHGGARDGAPRPPTRRRAAGARPRVPAGHRGRADRGPVRAAAAGPHPQVARPLGGARRQGRPGRDAARGRAPRGARGDRPRARSRRVGADARGGRPPRVPPARPLRPAELRGPRDERGRAS